MRSIVDRQGCCTFLLYLRRPLTLERQAVMPGVEPSKRSSHPDRRQSEQRSGESPYRLHTLCSSITSDRHLVEADFRLSDSRTTCCCSMQLDVSSGS
jgi:hypothetical protein